MPNHFTGTRRTLALAAGICFAVLRASAATNALENPEDFHIEITGSAWIVDSSGSIQAGGTPVDLVNDLGAEQQQPTFVGKLVFKPAQRQEIVVEGMPFSIQGQNTVERSIRYQAQTFQVSQTLRSSASLAYLFAGYQYNVLNGPAGHLGFSAGGAYVSATGTIQAVQAGTSATKSETLGLPLAGAEFRIFPLPGHKWIEAEGGMRGMAFGSYGHYVEADASGGVEFGPVAFSGWLPRGQGGHSRLP